MIDATLNYFLHLFKFIVLVHQITQKVIDLNTVLVRDEVGQTFDRDQPPSLSSRIGSLDYITFSSISGSIQINLDEYPIALVSFKPLLAEIELLVNHDLKILQRQLASVGTPIPLMPYQEYLQYGNYN